MSIVGSKDGSNPNRRRPGAGGPPWLGLVRDGRGSPGPRGESLDEAGAVRPGREEIKRRRGRCPQRTGQPRRSRRPHASGRSLYILDGFLARGLVEGDRGLLSWLQEHRGSCSDGLQGRGRILTEAGGSDQRGHPETNSMVQHYTGELRARSEESHTRCRRRYFGQPWVRRCRLPPALDLSVDDTVVLHDSNRIAVRLLPCDVLARVAAVAGQRGADSEVEIARRLAETDGPVAALDPRVEPRVYARDGFVVTFWTYYEPVSPRREVSPPEYAQALKRMHAGMREIDPPVPHFTDRVAEAQWLVGNREQSPELGAGRSSSMSPMCPKK